MLSSLSSVCFQVWEAQICYDPCISRWYSSKESSCQCRKRKRHGFDPWVGKSPWRRKWQSTPVLLPGESHGQRSLAGVAQSQTWQKRLSTHCVSGNSSEVMAWSPFWIPLFRNPSFKSSRNVKKIIWVNLFAGRNRDPQGQRDGGRNWE